MKEYKKFEIFFFFLGKNLIQFYIFESKSFQNNYIYRFKYLVQNN